MNTNDPLVIAGLIVIAIIFIGIEAVVRHHHDGDDPR